MVLVVIEKISQQVIEKRSRKVILVILFLGGGRRRSSITCIVATSNSRSFFKIRVSCFWEMEEERTWFIHITLFGFKFQT